MRGRTYVKVAAVCAAGMLTVTGCGGGGEDGGGSGARLSVVTGVYPLEWLAAQVGGDHVEVANLTEPGAEPHDLELTPRQVGQVADADLAFYVSGLQPAVDDAVSQQGDGNALDVADLVELRTAEENAAEEPHDHGGEESHGDEGGHDHAEDEHSHAGDEHAAEEDAHAEEEGAGESHGDEGGHDGHDHGEFDPHMWLDTERMAEAAAGLADRLAEIDPDHADAFAANAEEVTTLLDGIHEDYSTGLADCRSRDIVVSHTAFGYLAARYDLHQIPVAGLDSHSEPSPARMAEVAETVREHDVTTVFTEPLTSPEAAETIAAETGADTAVLDPLEGVTDASPGDDYPSIMRGNLEALSTALDCG
ncbi:zinc ABC transporter substrate-binding protein [Streptomonospora sp. S1-112]|uniref:Zinc ABC transporter substrate-binding protein n=1 Tax=Streptomonospora mangrovi TaxID=2883123 RepID=A0A9X3NHN0_9ACTN|nr:zinc ABC transporter substrate-binding protein [Streptomonospora mangrovi]MDA0563215.1 zinc ABC transporter substrate-binding protein [Streptomonospora mangrovi]